MSLAGNRRRTAYIDPQRVQRLLRTADGVVLFLATMAVFLGGSELIPVQDAPLVGFLALEVAVVGVLMMAWLGLYGIGVLGNPRRGMAGAMATISGVGAVGFAVAHFASLALAPGWLAGWLAVCAVHVAISRSGAALWAAPKAAAGAFRRRVAVVGGGPAADEAVRRLQDSDDLDIEVAGVVDDRRGFGVGGFDDLAGACRDGGVDLVIVAIPLSADARLLKALQRLWPLPVDIRIAGQTAQLKLSPRAFGYMGKLPLLAVFDRALAARFVAKDLVDRIAAALLLALLSPVLVLAALAIRLESGGPVLVRQQRYGFAREPIPVWRFRCTREDGDAEPPAFTRAGRSLRALKLDGLPQLFSVLGGDLSLVGPRPRATDSHSAAALYHQVIDGYFARHGVKPGMTGWAQINDWRGRPWTREAIENRVKHDLEYVDRWSLLFDLYILAKTPFALLRSADGQRS